MSQNNCYNLRPEALLAALIQSGFSADEIDVSLKGGFKRKYRGSLENLQLLEGDVSIQFNERSIYDQLPEGLFHQSRGNKHNQSYKNYIDEHNRYKQEAQWARKFFSPLDEVLLFAKADALLRKDNTIKALLEDSTPFLLKLWHLEEFADNSYITAFLALLNHSEQLKGRPDKIAKVLASLLGCDVTIAQRSASVVTDIERDERLQAESLLGFNTSLQSQGYEQMIYWHFTMSLDNLRNITQLATSKDVRELLELITYFFVPLDIVEYYEFLIPEPQSLAETFVGISTL